MCAQQRAAVRVEAPIVLSTYSAAAVTLRDIAAGTRVSDIHKQQFQALARRKGSQGTLLNITQVALICGWLWRCVGKQHLFSTDIIKYTWQFEEGVCLLYSNNSRQQYA